MNCKECFNTGWVFQDNGMGIKQEICPVCEKKQGEKLVPEIKPMDVLDEAQNSLFVLRERIDQLMDNMQRDIFKIQERIKKQENEYLEGLYKQEEKK